MFIDIESISPDSTYKFNSNHNYYLALINTSANNVTYVYKYNIPQLDNVSLSRKTFPINRSFKLTQSVFFTSEYCVKLFELIDNNTLNLLFSGNLDLTQLTPNAPAHIKLFTPSNARHTRYEDDTSMLKEQFFNFSTVKLKSNNKINACFVFLRLVLATTLPTVKPTVISLLNSETSIPIYHRYTNNIIRELTHTSTYGTPSQQQNSSFRSFIDNFCSNGSSYNDYLKIYQRENIFPTHINTKNLNFHQLLSRQIDHSHRPLMNQPHLNTLLTAPADGRFL